MIFEMLLLGGVGVAGADGPQAPLAALQSCRAITDDAARLACFDKAAAALDSAVQAKSVVVVDRATLNKARERQFGMTRRDDPVFTDAKLPEPRRLEAKLISVQPAGSYLQFAVEGGGVWQTTEAAFSPPLPGTKLVIEKGAVGGYFISYGARSVRARRVK